MAKYFATNSLAGLFRTSTGVTEITTAGRFDPAYTTLGVNINTSNDYAQASVFSSITGTHWVRFDVYLTASPSSTGALCQLMSGATNVFRLSQTQNTGGTPTFQPQYWNGAAWTNTGASFLLSGTALYSFAVKIILNTSFEAYVGGTLLSSGSGWAGSSSSCSNVRFYSAANNTTVYSQIMWADYDLRDSKLMLTAINGNSAANTGGTGTFTDINETPINETTAEAVSVSGNKMGQTKAALTLPGGFDIKGMVIAGRGRVSGTITDGKFGIRSGGVNYSSAALTFAAAYEPRVYISETDPNTGTDFTQAGYNSAESYFEAV
jgi:hypothetical protein